MLRISHLQRIRISILLGTEKPRRDSTEYFGPTSDQNHGFDGAIWKEQSTKANRITESLGRGGGDRTHDLRLKRPLLYH
jgi:hypothetical protein